MVLIKACILFAPNKIIFGYFLIRIFFDAYVVLVLSWIDSAIDRLTPFPIILNKRDSYLLGGNLFEDPLMCTRASLTNQIPIASLLKRSTVDGHIHPKNNRQRQYVIVHHFLLLLFAPACDNR